MVIRKGFNANPYVASLVEGLSQCGHDVECGLTLFWNSYYNYDIIFFQWPEAIFNWNIKAIDFDKLSSHLSNIKGSGIKMVITCHNLHPHNNDAKSTELYNLVYSKVDAFHHLGKYSFCLFKEKYPQQYHFVVPHHVSDIFWSAPIGSYEAKELLHVPHNKIVISSFGAFRNKGEVRLFVNMIKDIARKNMVFWAPRIRLHHIYNGLNVIKTIKYIWECIYFRIKKIKYSGFLSDEELKLWLSASDIVFIQRNEILNSGNIALAFSAGKVVVGPNLGNVGEILRETDNYVFDPYDRASVKDATLRAINSIRKDNRRGRENYLYAKNNWSITMISELISRELAQIKNGYP